MAHWIKYIAWIVSVGGLGTGIYYGYHLWKNDLTEVPAVTTTYTSSQVTEENHLTPPAPVPPAAPLDPPAESTTAIPAPALPGKCGRVLEMSVPSLGRMYTLTYAPTRPDEVGCLKKNPILLGRTVFPGDPGLSVISGHRDLFGFRDLGKLKTGDTITLNDGARKRTFRLASTQIVPGKTDIIPTRAKPMTGKYTEPTLFITTCHPFIFPGDAPNRYIMKMELVKEEPGSPLQTKGPVTKLQD